MAQYGDRGFRRGDYPDDEYMDDYDEGDYDDYSRQEEDGGHGPWRGRERGGERGWDDYESGGDFRPRRGDPRGKRSFFRGNRDAPYPRPRRDYDDNEDGWGSERDRRGYDGGNRGRGFEGSSRGRGFEGGSRGRGFESGNRGREFESSRGRGFVGGIRGRGFEGGSRGPREFEPPGRGRGSDSGMRGRVFEGRGRGFSRGAGGRGYEDNNRDQRDRGERGQPFVQELWSKSFFAQTKKFYVDVKENRRAKFIKIAEVSQTGQKMKILIDLDTLAEFHEKLCDLCDVNASLSEKKFQRGYENETTIQCESIFKDIKRYYLDLKENHRGRFLKCSVSVSNERAQIVIPAEGITELRDIITDILREFGDDDKKPRSNGNGRRGGGNQIIYDNRTFTIDVGNNQRGTYLRVSETSGSFHAAVTVGESEWTDFLSHVEQAMDDPESTKSASSETSTAAVQSSLAKGSDSMKAEPA